MRAGIGDARLSAALTERAESLGERRRPPVNRRGCEGWGSCAL